MDIDVYLQTIWQKHKIRDKIFPDSSALCHLAMLLLYAPK